VEVANTDWVAVQCRWIEVGEEGADGDEQEREKEQPCEYREE
jgi:hypothetical protein